MGKICEYLGVGRKKAGMRKRMNIQEREEESPHGARSRRSGFQCQLQGEFGLEKEPGGRCKVK